MATESTQDATIDITVKTLDGQNRTFNVPENWNVRQFKEKISGTIEISADTQRLIFQGRVMQDDKTLEEYSVHGKVVHLVQRAPPTTFSSSSTTSSTSTSAPSSARPQIQLTGNLFDVQLHLGRVQSTPNTREARARIQQAEFNLRLINDVLSQFEEYPRHASNPTQTATTADCSENRIDTSSPEPESQEQPQRPQHTSPETAEGFGNDQQTGLLATELASFLDQVLEINSRVETRLREYRNLLRYEENYLTDWRVQNAQNVVNRVSEICHALGHLLHSLSDITVDMSTSVPRQAVASPPVPFQIPGTASMAIPLQMNVRTRQDGNRNPQRSRQPTSTATDNVTTPTSTVGAPQNNLTDPAVHCMSSTVTSTASNPVIPPLSLPLPQSIPPPPGGDATVMVEMFPGIVTVVTEEEMDIDSNSSTESTEGLAGNRENITDQSSTPLQHPLEQPTATSSSTAPPSNPQRAGNSTFTTSTSSSSTFTIDPTTNVNMTGFDAGQIPQVPGLPPGFLQNILGSLLSSHGMIPGQPVEVNVIQQTTTSSGSPPRPPQQQFHDHGRSGPQNQQEHVHQHSSPTTCAPIPTTAGASVQTTSSTESSTATSVHNLATSTTSTGVTSSPTACTNTSAATNNPGVFTSTFNLPRAGSQSTTSGMRTGHSTIPASRPASAPRPFLFSIGSPGHPRLPVQGRSQQPRSSQPVSNSYVDPYLPCYSPQYMSQTALAALNASQGQTRWQQPSQHQVPNLSAMVSGMVGEIIGQASQQVLNNGSRTSSNTHLTTTTTTTTTPNSSSAPPATGTSHRSHSAQQPTPAILLNSFFTNLLRANATATQTGAAAPPVHGAMIGSVAQSASAPSATTSTNNGSEPMDAVWTLADLFTHVRRAAENRSGESGVINSLLEVVVPHLGVSDAVSLVRGNGHVLTRVREPLREFVTRLINQYGSVELLVDATLADMHSNIQYLQGLVQVREGTDMARSLYNCLMTHLVTIFSAIHSNSTGPHEDFGSHLYALFVTMMAETVGLCVYCIHDGHHGFLNMLQDYVPEITQGMSPVFTRCITTALQSTLRLFSSNHPVAESDIIGYVVSRTDTTTAALSQGQNQSKPETTSPANVPPRRSHTAEPHTNVSGTSSQTPINATKSPASQLPQAKVPRTAQEGGGDKHGGPQKTFPNSKPPVTPPSTLATHVTHTEGTVGGSRDVKTSDEWQSVIPQEWIPVISQDIVRQQEQRPQPPFSDAYLQGLPAKRRRLMSMDHSHEIGNISQYLGDSLKRAARVAGVQPYSSDEVMAQEAAENFDLHAELESEMTALLESRITTDQDFSLDRFPNAEEYFHKSKQH